MDTEQAEHFVQAAEHDYQERVALYRLAVWGQADRRDVDVAVGELRAARADVLAAQQVLMLAREELRLAERRAGERAALGRLPIGESGQWLEREEGEERG